MQLQLFCATAPVVELSPGTVVGGLGVGWPGLRSQLRAAGLDPWSCRWSEVRGCKKKHCEVADWHTISI